VAHLRIDRLRTRTPDGWLLEVTRTHSTVHRAPHLPPLLLVPGYGMNGFIFGFHPRGTSMTRSLAERGHEVWTVNLRAQRGSVRLDPSAQDASLEAYALLDLPAAIATVVAATHQTDRRVVVVGCSLGGSLAYAYLAHTPAAPVAAVIAMGAPLRWDDVHPAVRFAFGSPRLVSMVRMRGTESFARAALPLARRVPQLLSPYLNAAQVDLSTGTHMVRTIEDPQPLVNVELAHWIAGRDLVVRGVNVRAGLARVKQPLLVVVSNRDGIVPERASLSVLEAWGGEDVEVLRVGDPRTWWAHADLFVSDGAPEQVFEPLSTWLRARF
jgi:pimeloyl-ACP methyl ester carboxylesterase